MPNPSSLVAGALHRAAPLNRPPGRSALAIGTVGRTGEALINSLLAHPDYATVHVAVEAPLRSTLPRLRPWRIDPDALARPGDPAGCALPPVDDVYCYIDGSRSYYGRDRAYVPASAGQVPELARLAAAAGARRFILVSPLAAFLQLAAPAGGALHLREIDLIRLGFETLAILRPTTTGGGGRGNLLERLVARGASAMLDILMPQGLQPLSPHRIAQAALTAAALGPGVHLIGGDRIAALAPDHRTMPAS